MILLIGVWALVSPKGVGRNLLLNLAAALSAFFIAWHFATYVATALGANLEISELLQSLGIYAFDDTPLVFLPLAAQILMAVILGGLARSKIERGFAEYG